MGKKEQNILKLLYIPVDKRNKRKDAVKEIIKGRTNTVEFTYGKYKAKEKVVLQYDGKEKMSSKSLKLFSSSSIPKRSCSILRNHYRESISRFH